jgi:Na+-driven multidrug efflux pump
MKNINKYIKIWLCAFAAVTIIYLLLLFLIKNNNTESSEMNEIGKTYLKSVTPAYPPPMFNFTDSSNVLKKVIPIEKIS